MTIAVDLGRKATKNKKQRQLAMPLCCCGDVCDRNVRISALFGIFLRRHENAALV